MGELIVIMIYVGGFYGVPEGFGFWRTILWPIELGRLLASALPARPTKGGENG